MITTALAGLLAVTVVVVPGPHSPVAPRRDSAAPQAAATGVDLAGWKLTLPVAGDHGHGAATVRPTDAAAAPWLRRDRDGGVTMWAPVNGATTPHSGHARTELVSLSSFAAGVGGPHTLRASATATRLPRQKPDIILGQIHGAAPITSVPFVMLHLDMTNGTGIVRVVVKRAQHGSASQQFQLLSGVGLGARIGFSLTDSGNGSMRFTASAGSASRTITVPIPAPFRGAPMRFQVGDYQQAEAPSTGGGGNPSGGAMTGDGGQVRFDQLSQT